LQNCCSLHRRSRRPRKHFLHAPRSGGSALLAVW
jgi:hypothetical protein